MSHPISVFYTRLGRLPGVAAGCYTVATLAQLAQSLSRLALEGADGALLYAEGEQLRAWADLAARGSETQVRRVALPAAPARGAGLFLIGLGRELGFVIAAAPSDPNDRDESVRLYDVRWSCDPAAVASLAELVAAGIPDDLAGRPGALRAATPAELQSLSADLLEFAARQHSTYAVTNRSLNERLRNHEDQTRMIVHDMRAPLHTLLISIKALQRQRFDPEGQAELLTVASESAGYLLTLTETVLDSARLETSGWSLKRQQIQLAAMVQAICEPLELAARPDQAVIRREVPDDLPRIWLDRGLMERVLTNLLMNAIKYTPPDGEIAVAARLVNDNNAIALSVSDTGQGIAPAAQAHIFERFYQANESDRRRGTGLGLYFCRLAVEAHGGSIAVQSALGAGSTFTILLPLTGEE